MRNGFEDLDLGTLRRRRSEKWRAFGPDVLPAFIAEMDYDLAGPVADVLRAAVELGDCGYANATGLGESFAQFAAARHDWTVSPDRVHLVADVMSGVDAVFRLTTEPGDRIVINPPVYPPFYEHILGLGRHVSEVPLARGEGGWELDFAALEEAFVAGARGYLLCSPHNPTGRVFGAGDLERIATLAARYDVMVVADEIHAPLTLAGVRHTPYLTVGRGVAFASASKAFNIAGLKCAVAVAGSAANDRMLGALPSSCHYGAGLLGVLTTQAAWRDGGPWLDTLLVQLDEMRSLFGKLLATRLPEAGYLPPEAGYLGWVDCTRLGLGDDPSSVFLDRGQVALGRGLDFGPQGAGFSRVTLGTSSAILTEIADRMARAG